MSKAGPALLLTMAVHKRYWYRQETVWARRVMTDTADTAPIFFYGSLQDDDVLRLVLSRADLAGVTMATAVLPGHAVERVEGHVFPMIVSAPGREAPGRLVHGLSADERARIAFFEDSDYRLTCTDVIADGAARRALCFMPADGIRSSGQAWRIEDWPAEQKALLIACAEEQMSYFGVHPQNLVETWWPDIEARARARLERDRAI